MLIKKYISCALIFIFLIGGSFFISHNSKVFAEVHEHQQHGGHGQHTHSIKTTEVIVDVETSPASIKAGSMATILFSIKDKEGKPLQDLTITHDRLLHVVIVSEDFSVFAHIHPEDFGPITPEMKKTAKFMVRYPFPKAGHYLIAVDSAVKDVPFSEHFTIDITGEPKMDSFKKDFSREKQFEDYKVTFTSKPERIAAGKEITLKYAINKDGKTVTDLEPYLSAPMHLAIIMSNLNNFIHTHGEVPGALTAQQHTVGHFHGTVPEKFGPEIEAHVVFPAKGVYQIFSEVKHQGKVILLNFMVEVE